MPEGRGRCTNESADTGWGLHEASGCRKRRSTDDIIVEQRIGIRQDGVQIDIKQTNPIVSPDGE